MKSRLKGDCTTWNALYLYTFILNHWLKQDVRPSKWRHRPLSDTKLIDPHEGNITLPISDRLTKQQWLLNWNRLYPPTLGGTGCNFVTSLCRGSNDKLLGFFVPKIGLLFIRLHPAALFSSKEFDSKVFLIAIQFKCFWASSTVKM